MRVILQRVARASVSVDGEVVGRAGRGLLILLGVTHSDTALDADWLADRVVGVRIFPDDDGKMNRSVLDIRGDILVVSQFTLYGDASRGRRPSFVHAAPPEVAIPLYEEFLARLRTSGLNVESGVFGAMMQVELVNDGPVTLTMER